ncbi:MAG: phage holin family protein [Chloroflexota bacterium]|nr:phage holin family protein [Chloroflexota bacterium]
MNTSQDAHGGSGDGPGGQYQLAGAPEGLGALISGVIKDLQDLLRAEVQLAKTELREDATGIGKALAFIAAGAFIGLVGLIFLIQAIVWILDEFVNDWLAATIVAVALLAIAAILALSGRSKLSATNLKPEQTIETLKEDQQWAKQQINSAKR